MDIVLSKFIFPYSVAIRDYGYYYTSLPLHLQWKDIVFI